MLCYRDMTFCTYWEDCDDAPKCHRPLTEEVRTAADRWWGDEEGSPPIACFAQMPDCHTKYPTLAERMKRDD